MPKEEARRLLEMQRAQLVAEIFRLSAKIAPEEQEIMDISKRVEDLDKELEGL